MRSPVGNATAYQDALNLKLKGKDAQPVRRWIETWGDMVSNLDSGMPEQTLLLLLKKQIDEHRLIPEDIAHYERQDEGHPERTYSWLYKRINKWVERTLGQANYEAYRRHMDGGDHRANPAKGRGRGNGKPGAKRDASRNPRGNQRRDNSQARRGDAAGRDGGSQTGWQPARAIARQCSRQFSRRSSPGFQATEEG